ncbi:MAG: hypothetical protein PUC57_05435, partial [Oscillospiraceae bacterium]|nr:hypothetical protein [Oscillospiraceae bacterium]
CLETRKAATKKAAAIPQSPIFCYFGAMRDFSSNETPHFPARLLSLFFVVKNRGKRIKTNQQTLKISGIFRFVFIIVYGHTFISIIQQLPESDIKAIVGHSSSMDTFGVYAHSVDGRKASIAEDIEKVFDEIISK